MVAAPGSVRPMASSVMAMVDAVPMVMQVPNDRAIPSSICFQASSLTRPALRSAQYFQTSVPEPRWRPAYVPRNIGPAGITIAGTSALSAPITIAGSVLSQPPSRTAPSIGFDLSNSSVSMASRLQYSIVVGRMKTSPNDIAGSSTG